MTKRHIYLMLMCMFCISFVFGQRTITGTVTDAKTKEPVMAVLVLVEGTSVATTTDINGKYSINVPATGKNLVFTMIGMTTSTQIIGASNVIDVTMTSNDKMLADVVVTAVGIKREARSLGYSTTTVKNDELTRGNDRSALNSLQGKVAGVDISNGSGSPGSSTRFVIRGGTSITRDNQALIVVDGIPIDNSSFGFDDVINNQTDYGNRANDINPNDIESISVLKGLAATSLYGSRGSNGAVIITTKSGKGVKGKLSKNFKVSVNSNITFQNILKYPELQNEFGQGLYGDIDLRENTNWGLKYDGQIRPWGQAVLDDSGNYVQKVKPYVGLPNNYKSFFRLGVSYSNGFSVGGGTDKTSFYLSYNNLTNQGVIPTTSYKRNTVKLNVSHEFSDKLSAGANITYSKTNGDLTVQGQGDYSVLFQLYQTPRDISFEEIKDYNDKFNTLDNFYNGYYYNPYYILDNQKNINNVDRFTGVANLSYKPVKWLDITTRIGSDNYTDSRYQKLKRFSLVNRGSEHTFKGLYSEDIYRVNDVNEDLLLTGTANLKHDMKLNVMIGQNLRSRSVKNTFARTNGLVIDDFFALENSEGRPVQSNSTSTKRNIGVYGTIDWSWKNTLFVGLSARNDWSSTLPVNKRSYFYPGANLSFVFSELIKENTGKILSFGKLRLGWAMAGNDADPYLIKPYFVQSLQEDGYLNSEVRPPYVAADPAITVPGYTISDKLTNPNLKPEITRSFEIGTELSFFKDRLGIDFTYYNNKSRNLILPASQIAPSSGYTNQVVNLAAMTNNGFELAVRIVPVSTKSGLKWELFGTFTKNINKVTELAGGRITLGGLSNMAIIAQNGLPYGSFFAQTVKTDPNGNPIVDSATGIPILTDTSVVLGNYQAKWMGSWGTKLSYKGFTFNILFNTRQGGMIYSKTKTDLEFGGSAVSTTYNDREDFVVPNSVYEAADGSYVKNTDAKVTAQDYWSIYKQEDRGAALIDASYIKLREVSISYDFPSKWFKNTKSISGLQLSLFGNNLALWTPKSNSYIDPEASSYGNGNAQGFEFGTIPSLRSFGFGLKADF